MPPRMTTARLRAPTQWEGFIQWTDRETPLNDVPLEDGWSVRARRQVLADGSSWFLQAMIRSVPHGDEQYMKFQMQVTIDERTNARVLLYLLEKARNRFFLDFEIRKTEGESFTRFLSLAGRVHQQLAPSVPFLSISLDGPPLRIVKGSSRSQARVDPGWGRHVRESHPSQFCGKRCPVHPEICHFRPGHEGYCECQWCGQRPGVAPSEVYNTVWKTSQGWADSPDGDGPDCY